jgi:hypothetical protein
MECQTLERYDKDMNPVYKPKRAFDTQDEAIEVAKFINSQDHVIHKIVPYKCKVCHKYHLGRNGKELKDKERQKHKKQIYGISTH